MKAPSWRTRNDIHATYFQRSTEQALELYEIWRRNAQAQVHGDVGIVTLEKAHGNKWRTVRTSSPQAQNGPVTH